MSDYREKVLAVGAAHDYNGGCNGELTKYRIKRINESLKGLNLRNALEIGPGTGSITKDLLLRFERVVAVEPVESWCARVGEMGAETHNLFFEDFETDEKFDVIVASGVLEHVEDPNALLQHMQKFMHDETVAMFIVPNAGSLHRHLGRAMGLIKTLEELTPLDRQVGHYRYYNFSTLQNDFERNGYTVLRMSGIFLKPLPSSEMNRLPKDKYYDALDYVGRSLPTMGAEIFLMARRFRPHETEETN